MKPYIILEIYIMLLELFFFKNNNIIKNKIENIQLINNNKYLIMNRKQCFDKLIN